MPKKTIIKKQSQNVTLIDPKKISPKKGFNPRRDLQLTPDFCNSIALGIKQPLRVYEHKKNLYFLIDGERRLKAHFSNYDLKKSKALEPVPCIIEKPKDDKEALLLNLLLSEGEKLTPMEEGAAFKRLIDSGMTQKDISDATGKSAFTVSSRLSLLDMPSKVATELEAGNITTTQASAISSKVKTSKKKASASKPKTIIKDGIKEAKAVRPMNAKQIEAIIATKTILANHKKTSKDEKIFIHGVIHGLAIASRSLDKFKWPFKYKQATSFNCAYRNQRVAPKICCGIIKGKDSFDIPNPCLKCINYRRYTEE